LKKRILGSAVLGALVLAAAAYAAENKFHEAKPGTYDPAKTFLVASLGCRHRLPDGRERRDLSGDEADRDVHGPGLLDR